MFSNELSLEELEGERAVLLPPREEMKKKFKNKQKGLVNVNISNLDVL